MAPRALLLLVCAASAAALENRNAHRSEAHRSEAHARVALGAHGQRSFLSGTASRSSQGVAAGQANIFTDVFGGALGWAAAPAAPAAPSPEAPGAAATSSNAAQSATGVDNATQGSATLDAVNGSGTAAHSALRVAEVAETVDAARAHAAKTAAQAVLANGSGVAELETLWHDGGLGAVRGLGMASDFLDRMDKLDTGLPQPLLKTDMKTGTRTDMEGQSGTPLRRSKEGANASSMKVETPGLNAMVKSVQDAAWKDGLTSGVVFDRTERTCIAGQQYCKSLCRWLKLSDKDFDITTANKGSCPLFDWSMESLGYTAPSARNHLSPEPADCATTLLSRNVHRKDVGTYVLQLEECMVGLPQGDSEKYSVSLQVVANEIAGWRKEQSVREDAAPIELHLQDAIEQGRKAYFNKVGEAEAVGALTFAMRKAKTVDGHYMIDDVRIGRELLEKLQPLVLAGKELADNEKLGRVALEDKLEKEVHTAIVLLNVSIETAENVGLGAQTTSAKHVRNDLLDMQSIMSEIQASFFQANVSVRTKLHTSEAITAMNATMAKAKAAHIVASLTEGRRLVTELEEIADAKDELANAVKRARAAMNNEPNGEEGLGDLLGDTNALQAALSRATRLHLTSHVTSEAVKMMASLEESKAARQSLRAATLHAHAIALDPSTLDITSEESAIGELSGALSWAEHARLEHSMPIARELMKMLSVLRDAKMLMSNSLAVGSASLQAIAGQENAIEMLSKSMREAKALNMTAGTVAARAQLKRLRQQVDARDALEDAVAHANQTVRAKVVHPNAVSDLNASITRAAEAGLKAEVVIAKQQLDRLEALRDALDDINIVIGVNAPERPAVQLPELHDHQRVLNITVPDSNTGLKVTDLPDVAGSHDDGDRDFEEHIRRLSSSIVTARHYGLVDPEMLEQVAQLQKFQDAWDMLNASTQEGKTALESKDGVYRATVHIQDAIRLAQKVGLKVGIRKARHLLNELWILPSVKNDLEAAILQGGIALHHKTGIHDALLRLNGALGEADRFGLHAQQKKAQKLRDRLAATSEAWLQLRAAAVQGSVALRLEHGEDAAIDALQGAIAGAEAAGLSSETSDAAGLLSELRQMNTAHQSIELAVVPSQD